MRITASKLLCLLILLAGPLACEKKPTSASDQPGSDPATHEQPTDKPDQPGEKTACGGIAGLPCPEAMKCVDDPADDCDPEQGGRDCMGMCVQGGDETCEHEADPNKTYVGKSPDACATMRFTCEAGREYFSDDCGCGCAVVSAG